MPVATGCGSLPHHSCRPGGQAMSASQRHRRRRGPRRPCRSLCRSWVDSRTGVRQCRCAATPAGADPRRRGARPTVQAGGCRQQATASATRSASVVVVTVPVLEQRKEIGATSLLLSRAIQIPRHGRVVANLVPPLGQNLTQTNPNPERVHGSDRAARHPGGPSIGTNASRVAAQFATASDRPASADGLPPEKTAAARRAARGGVGSRPQGRRRAAARVAGVIEQASYSQLDRSRAASRSLPVRAASRSSHWPR